MIKYLNIEAKRLMSDSLISVIPDTIVTEVDEIFKSNSFHHIPVINEDKVCVGIISKMDYCQLQHHFTRIDGERDKENNRFFASLLASDIMTPNPVTVTDDILLSDLIKIFKNQNIRSVIVTRKNECVGIITPMDLIAYLEEVLINYQKAIA